MTKRSSHASRATATGKTSGSSTDLEGEIAKQTAARHLAYAELEENGVDLKELVGWLEKHRRLDFSGPTLGTVAAERLRECEARLEGYAQRIFRPRIDARNN